MASGAEDCKQAFFWRHLVPSQEMTAWVRKKWQGQQKNKKQRR
jgi:hypothetical protein